MALREHSFGIASLTEPSYTDPETLRLADKVTCEIDPDVQAVFPKKRGAKVRVTMKNGTVYERELYDLKGSPSNPVGLEELEKKFLTNTKGVIPEGRTAELLQLFSALEGQEKIDRLIGLLP